MPVAPMRPANTSELPMSTQPHSISNYNIAVSLSALYATTKGSQSLLICSALPAVVEPR